MGTEWGIIHSRAFTTDGVVVDLGCKKWDWSRSFLGKKEVIGVDPIEDTIPDGAKLFRGIVTNCSGTIRMNIDGESSTISRGGTTLVESITFDELCNKFSIDKISIMKMNIEGSEYSLLISMNAAHFNMIDQMVISFHDFLNAYNSKQTNVILSYLETWYTITNITNLYRWFLFLRK